MFAKIFSAIFLVGACCVYTQVDAQCMDLLRTYYHCKNPNTTLDNTFFQSQLGGITTFNGAMDKYKSIFTELDWNTCSSALCTCVKGNILLNVMNYGAFFVNSNYYSDMVSILTAVRNKYTRSPYLNQIFTLMNMTITINDTISQFCSNYDYSMLDLYNYNETMYCMYEGSLGSLTCAQYVSNVTNITDLITDTTSYENYLKCSVGLISKCDVEIKRDLVYNMVSYAPSMIKNGLLTYVNSLISSADADSKNATVTWVTGDPHINSVMKSFETCNFDTTVVCVNSDNVTINCTGVKVSTSLNVTLLSEVRIRFSKGGQTSDYIADQTSFPGTLSNGQATLKDSNGQDWLKLTTFIEYGSSKYDILIIDYNSNMVIAIGKWELTKSYFMVIQAPKLSYKMGGILFDGCPTQYKAQRQTATRRKRASSNAASVCSSSTQQSGSSLISSSDLYAACVNDVVVTGDESFASMYKSTLDAYSEVKSAYTTAFGSGTQLRSTFSYLLLSIAFFLFKFF